MRFDSKKWMMFLAAMPMFFSSFAAGSDAAGKCETSLKLDGAVSVVCCAPTDGCIPADKAVYEYTEAAKDDPAMLSISLQSSPWHLYDGDMRILTVDELAQMVKPYLKKGVKRIVLVASWTGVSPDGKNKSIAQKLSDLLDGFPVSGMDGFVWLSKDGSVRTTQQAFTMKKVCPYEIHPGEDVMVSLVAGWPVEYEEDIVKSGDSDGLLRAGAGWDIFMLCPDKALELFEAAAKLSNPTAAYNAALIRLDSGTKADREAAVSLLRQAAGLGDKKAEARFKELTQ